MLSSLKAYMEGSRGRPTMCPPVGGLFKDELRRPPLLLLMLCLAADEIECFLILAANIIVRLRLVSPCSRICSGIWEKNHLYSGPSCSLFLSTNYEFEPSSTSTAQSPTALGKRLKNISSDSSCPMQMDSSKPKLITPS